MVEKPDMGRTLALEKILGIKTSSVALYRQLGDLARDEGQLGEVPVEGSATWWKCYLGDFNLSDFLGTIFILIHLYLINATNEHYSLSKIYLIFINKF